MNSNLSKIANDSIQNHPYVLITMIIIVVGFIIYGLYYYFSNTNEYNLKYGSSYYGTKLIDYKPLFQISSDSLSDCVKRCDNDILCSGITYDKDTQECVGTSGEGLLREENKNLVAWLKPQNQQKKESKIDYVKSIILGYSNEKTIIPSNKITRPYSNGSYSFSFNLCIKDYHHNYGKWRHILHKGTPLPSSEKLNFNSWETLVLNFKDQFIGVWLAPYNNNLRIAISTIYITKNASNYFEHANIQICNSGDCFISDVNKNTSQENTLLSIAPQNIIKNIEFIDHDITKIPINIESTFVINVFANNIEFYQDGKLVKSALLEGTPEFNNDNLYVMHPYSIDGFIRNLAYYPTYLTLNDISEIQKIPKS